MCQVIFVLNRVKACEELTFFSTGLRLSAVDVGTSIVTPPSTTPFGSAAFALPICSVKQAHLSMHMLN